MSFSSADAEPVFPSSVPRPAPTPSAPLPLTMTDRAYLTGYSFSLLRDWQTAEAVINEIIVTAWQNQAKAPQDRSCLEWVQEMLYHRCITVRSHVRRETNGEDAGLGQHFHNCVWNVWSRTRKAKFEMEITSAEKTLAGMPAVDRASCALYFTWHQNMRQVAAATGCTREKASKRIDSVRKKILKPISKHFGSSMQGVELHNDIRRAYSRTLRSDARQSYCVSDFLQSANQAPEAYMQFAEFLWEWAVIATAITRLESRAPTLAQQQPQQTAVTSTPQHQTAAYQTVPATNTTMHHGVALGSTDSSLVPTAPLTNPAETAAAGHQRSIRPAHTLAPPGARVQVGANNAPSASATAQ